MLAPGRTLAELLAVAARVYGKPQDVYQKQHGMLLTLGALRGEPWGEQDEQKVAAIKQAARDVVRGAA